MADERIEDYYATVTHVHAKSCTVFPDLGGEEVQCVLSGKLYEDLGKETKPVAVGDRVQVQSEGRSPAVVKVLERRNSLLRPSVEREKAYQVIAANVDRMLIVSSLRSPRLVPGLVDRFLVVAGIEEMDGLVCLNKIDLSRGADDEARIEEFRSVYAAAGYQVIVTSALDGRGVPELKNHLTEGITLIVGKSGVGKSTLLNAMDPALELTTGDISRKWKQGRHTTTSVKLLRLESGGFVIDTPGLREFGIATIEPFHLGHYFPEFEDVLKDCRFPNCTHDHEPDCAVKAKVEAGEIPTGRYESYLRILKSLV
jgi:ribosome biogenesis GTPase